MARISNAFLLLALLGVVGCRKSDDRKPAFAVSGTAIYKGEPMAGAMISFHPHGDTDPRALRAQATADREGRFQMTTYATGDGVPAGEYAVTIYWPAKRTKGKVADPTAEEEDMPPDRLNKVYTVPATTKLRATVREQPNTIDFNLP